MSGPARDYLVKYIFQEYEVVRATSQTEAQSKVDDLFGDTVDILDAFEMSQEYEVDLFGIKKKIRAEYHRDTPVDRQGESKPPVGLYTQRPNKHFLFISAEQLDRLSVAEQELAIQQIFSQEDHKDRLARDSDVLEAT